jgi:hypothetical protein
MVGSASSGCRSVRPALPTANRGVWSCTLRLEGEGGEAKEGKYE